jgi:hypothetical protein
MTHVNSDSRLFTRPRFSALIAFVRIDQKKRTFIGCHRVVACGLAICTGILLLSPKNAAAYPTDEYERTGISRLKWQYDVDHGVHRGLKAPPGAQWPSARIRLNMLKEGQTYQLTPETPKDRELQQGLQAILMRHAFRHYNVAILDITDPANPRYAGVNETAEQNPGSVAKLLVAAGLMRQLRERYPDDVAKREKILKDTQVAADDWSVSDPHEVPFVTGDKLENIYYRPVRLGDTFSLWEWLDHTLSASNNSAASMLWREATLMKLLKADYPPAARDAQLLERWDKQALTDAAFAVVDEPQAEADLSVDTFHVRLFFTAHANRYIQSKSATATPLALLQWMVRMEQGRVVDEYSSLELKKMLYLTRRRVRYAAADELNPCGVWFKSGSLFICSAQPCAQYEGDVVNILNGLTEVETPVPPENPAPANMASPENPPPTEPAEQSPPSAEPAKPSPPATGPVMPAPPAAAHAARAPSTAAAAKPAPPPPGVAKDGKRHVYIVAVMSNELKRNAASDHAILASQIHRLMVGEY